MSRLVMDLETDGLLLDVTVVWCAVTYDLDTKKYVEYRQHEMKKLLKNLDESSELIMHNGIAYDLKVLEKLFGYKYTGTVIDTLLLAKLAYYAKDKSWSHSLDAYGERLGEKKGTYDDWSKFTEEMLVYNKQDVKVTAKLYSHLKRKTIWMPKETLEIESAVQEIVATQYVDGFYFDKKKGEELHVELTKEKEEAERELHKVFTPTYLPEGKVKIPKRTYRRLGIVTCGPYQPIKLSSFNPGSSRHVVHWIESVLGKQIWFLTDKGNPKTDAETLKEMFEGEEFTQPLLHYLEVTKILGQLAEGPAAWLRLYREDTHRIHGGIDILGTVSGRCSHSRPNLGQVPSVRAFKGKEARDLFTCPADKVLVGCDLSGVELRCMAHFMYPYDGGRYADIILQGDIHTANQEAAGLETRDQAKTFCYATIYGAGDSKIGSIVGGGAKEGKRLKANFLAGTPGYEQLSNDIKKAAKKKWLKGITGRRLFVRSPHSAMNVVLQSLGSYIAKQWLIEAKQMAEEQGIIYKQISFVHDETTWEVAPEDSEKVSKILEQAALRAGEVLGVRIPIEAEAQVGRTWKEIH